MNFVCQNCGGSVVFLPEKQQLFCPHCDQYDSAAPKGDDSLTNCPNCGAVYEFPKFTSASQCPYCDNYVILDKMVTGDYAPDSIIPFQIGKQRAVSLIDESFGKRRFVPVSFLSEKTLESMQGRYVPFFLYDYKVDAEYHGVGTTIRRWRSGDYDYTETSYYDIARRMIAEYDNIPADASAEMPDDTMDLLEPYEYHELMNFDPKFMPGFYGEVYNDYGHVYEPRARAKAQKSSQALLRESVTGYATINPPITSARMELQRGKMDYALFPVWVYKYKWGGREYPIYVNGQNGKVVGKTPISVPKVLVYTFTLGGLIWGIIFMLCSLLGGLL